MWKLEHATDRGDVSRGLMTKAAKGQRGWWVQVSEEYGYHAPTRREAIRTFEGLSNEAATIKEKENE